MVHDLKIRILRCNAEKLVVKLYREGHPLLIEHGLKNLTLLHEAFEDLSYFQMTMPTRALFTWEGLRTQRLYYVYGRRKCFGDDLRGYIANLSIERALGFPPHVHLPSKEGDIIFKEYI